MRRPRWRQASGVAAARAAAEDPERSAPPRSARSRAWKREACAVRALARRHRRRRAAARAGARRKRRGMPSGGAAAHRRFAVDIRIRPRAQPRSIDGSPGRRLHCSGRYCSGRNGNRRRCAIDGRLCIAAGLVASWSVRVGTLGHRRDGRAHVDDIAKAGVDHDTHLPPGAIDRDQDIVGSAAHRPAHRREPARAHDRHDLIRRQTRFRVPGRTIDTLRLRERNRRTAEQRDAGRDHKPIFQGTLPR